jgi:mannosyltransferase
MKKNVFLNVLVIILVPAIIVVFAYNTKSFWGDEILSIQFASKSIGELFKSLAADYHPPLYFLLLKFWIHIFGDGEFVLRVFQGLMGILFLLFALLLFRKIFPERAYHPFFFLLALSNEFLLFMPMLRYYTLAAALVVLSTLVFFNWLERDNARNSFWLLLSYAAILYTDYPSSIVIVFHLVYVGLKKRGVLQQLLFINVAAGVIFLPWVYITVEQIQRLVSTQQLADFNASPFSVILKIGYSFYAFVMGEMIYPFEVVGILATIILSLFLLFALKRKILVANDLGVYAFSLVLAAIVFTSLITTFISTHTSFIYTPARTFFALVFVFIILGLLYDKLEKRVLKHLLIITIIVLDGYGITNWILNRHFLMPVYATPWKQIMNDVEHHSGWMIADESLCYEYYQHHLSGSFPQLKKFSSVSELRQSMNSEKPSNVYLLQMGRESTESEIPEEIVHFLQETFTPSRVSKYLVIDESYRTVKAKLLKRDSYDAKVTLYHFIPR